MSVVSAPILKVLKHDPLSDPGRDANGEDMFPLTGGLRAAPGQWENHLNVLQKGKLRNEKRKLRIWLLKFIEKDIIFLMNKAIIYLVMWGSQSADINHYSAIQTGGICLHLNLHLYLQQYQFTVQQKQMHLKCQLRQEEGTQAALGLSRAELAHMAFPAYIFHWRNLNRKQL